MADTGIIKSCSPKRSVLCSLSSFVSFIANVKYSLPRRIPDAARIYSEMKPTNARLPLFFASGEKVLIKFQSAVNDDTLLTLSRVSNDVNITTRDLRVSSFFNVYYTTFLSQHHYRSTCIQADTRACIIKRRGGWVENDDPQYAICNKNRVTS